MSDTVDDDKDVASPHATCFSLNFLHCSHHHDAVAADDEARDWNKAINTVDCSVRNPVHAPDAQATNISHPNVPFGMPPLAYNSKRESQRIKSSGNGHAQTFNTKNNSHSKVYLPETCSRHFHKGSLSCSRSHGCQSRHQSWTFH